MRFWRWLCTSRGMWWHWGHWDLWRWHRVSERSWRNISQLPFALWSIRRDARGWGWMDGPSVWLSLEAVS